MLVILVTPFTDEDRGQEPLQTCLAQSSLPPLYSPPLSFESTPPHSCQQPQNLRMDPWGPSWLLSPPQILKIYPPHSSAISTLFFSLLFPPHSPSLDQHFSKWVPKNPRKGGVAQSINFGKYFIPYALLKESQCTLTW